MSGDGNMDQGIRIIWYDLADEEKDQYLEWLHNEYLPHLMARPGILWAAHYKIIKTDKTIQKLSQFVGRPDDFDDVPAGSEYALLVGAGSPHLFFKSNSIILLRCLRKINKTKLD